MLLCLGEKRSLGQVWGIKRPLSFQLMLPYRGWTLKKLMSPPYSIGPTGIVYSSVEPLAYFEKMILFIFYFFTFLLMLAVTRGARIISVEPFVDGQTVPFACFEKRILWVVIALSSFQPHLHPQIQIGKYVQCGISRNTIDKRAKERSSSQRIEALTMAVVALLQYLHMLFTGGCRLFLKNTNLQYYPIA